MGGSAVLAYMRSTSPVERLFLRMVADRALEQERRADVRRVNLLGERLFG